MSANAIQNKNLKNKDQKDPHVGCGMIKIMQDHSYVCSQYSCAKCQEFNFW